MHNYIYNIYVQLLFNNIIIKIVIFSIVIKNIKLLLEKGADPKQKIKGGKYNGIHFACMEDTENNLKIIKLLINKCPEIININGIGRKSPLHFACFV